MNCRNPPGCPHLMLGSQVHATMPGSCVLGINLRPSVSSSFSTEPFPSLLPVGSHVFLKLGLGYLAQGYLNLMIPLPQPPDCWTAGPCPHAYTLFLFNYTDLMFVLASKFYLLFPNTGNYLVSSKLSLHPKLSPWPFFPTCLSFPFLICLIQP